ncbi:hypothetical protein [Pseudoalteromonas sp. APC 3355]|uniref:hypothetical protein n=1 Tax=Pseudoalteromonas sp. APC 3355 TaxID=3035199 RepID=UPI0025B28EC8|nr:hypothetical protein [Pseudoalteromonas sp. APC 3355]MDN3475545.1 hypothetical protein [Pseudoalteromonas sp. APC 3355]
MIYPIVILAFININGESSRIIASVGESYYSQYFDYAFQCQILIYIAILIPLLTIRKKIFTCSPLPIGNGIRLIFLGALFLTYPVAYPAIFGFSNDRFGSGGSLLLIFNAILILSRQSKLNIIDYLTIAINLFALFSGERADTILILFSYFLLTSDGTHIKEKNLSNLKLFSALLILFIVGLISGINRVGGEFSLGYLAYYLLNQGTAVDVIHVYLSSFWYVENIGFNTDPLINFIYSFFPFNSIGGASSEYNVTSILREHIPSVGGGLFYTAGYVSFGLFGAILCSFFYGLYIKLCFNAGTILSTLFIAIFIQQLRLQWYGLTYMGNVVSFGIIVFSVIYFFKVFFSKKGRYE